MTVKWSRNSVAQLKQSTKTTKRATFYARRTIHPLLGSPLIGKPTLSGVTADILVVNLEADLATGDTGNATIDPSGDQVEVVNNTGRTLLQTTRCYAFRVQGFTSPPLEVFPNQLADCPDTTPVQPPEN